MQRILVVDSLTYYGRGTAITGEEFRESIRIAKAVLDAIVPDKRIYGYCDEDYGWFAVLDKTDYQRIREQYPASLAEHEFLYVHNSRCEYVDMFVVDVNGQPQERMATIRPLRREDQKFLEAKPVKRTLAAMTKDWFDNYGSK